ncbi:MAG: AAA family ATPase [Nitrososphaerales archaeon]|nr:AAA family ATPase [Nitrososphaerales archaeon]
MLTCGTTEELTPTEEIIGQERALRALKFGLEMDSKGFNIYVAGIPGTGKVTAIRSFLEEIAKTKPTPPDWVYVNNFKNPYEPKAIKLPAGMAREFQRDIKNFIDEAKRAIPKILQSDEYISKREQLIKAAEEHKEKLLSEFREEAQRSNFAIQLTPMGIVMIPIFAGRPITNQEYLLLPLELRREFDKNRERLEGRLNEILRQMAEFDRRTREELRRLTNDTIQYALGFLIGTLLQKYEGIPEVRSYLNDLRNDILENIELFSRTTEASQAQATVPPWMRELPFRRYEVNIIVDNSELKGAPVVFEDNPTYNNLFGRIEKEAQFGTFTTDFTLIKGGSLHRANGGFLVLSIEEVLKNLFSYDGLKRTLKNGYITIEEAGERLGFISTKSLTPQPIPLNVKVILVGSPLLYHLLYIYDPDFRELFKVKAEFDTTIERNDENIKKYASFICTLCRKEGLRHLESSAIAKVVEYGSRLASDKMKLSTRFADVADLLREANFYAAQDGSKYIKDIHIKRAIEEKVYRSNLLQQKIREMIERGLILIDTQGEKIGQVNALSVISLGDFTFGRPSRVTASVGLGREGVIDIEREAKMGGPIHTKGVLILGGYLTNKYARDKPISLSARLVFEQSYEGVEGDSASSTELYAILSALAELPIKQNLAVTGSVNQKGEVQAVGGINEKIEGFFEVCKAKGLKGNEGVIIPESNVQNLMLKDEVIEAVRAGKFHIYAVKTIDEGIELLTGVKAGERMANGEFEPGTVNYRVDKRLREMAETLAKFAEVPVVGKGSRSDVE